jgi:hypothetical protein
MQLVAILNTVYQAYHLQVGDNFFQQWYIAKIQSFRKLTAGSSQFGVLMEEKQEA